MQIKTFKVSVFDPEADEAELNRFLRGHRVLEVRQQFFATEERQPHWLFAVSYVESNPAAKPLGRTANKRERVDYKSVLSEAAFGRYVRLRELRKEWAKRDAVPAYAVFTNEQLAAMVEPVARTKADLLKIEGIGETRVAKYGAGALETLQDEAGGDPKAESGNQERVSEKE